MMLQSSNWQVPPLLSVKYSLRRSLRYVTSNWPILYVSGGIVAVIGIFGVKESATHYVSSLMLIKNSSIYFAP
jgi:hypothetical protein